MSATVEELTEKIRQAAIRVSLAASHQERAKAYREWWDLCTERHALTHPRKAVRV